MSLGKCCFRNILFQKGVVEINLLTIFWTWKIRLNLISLTVDLWHSWKIDVDLHYFEPLDFSMPLGRKIVVVLLLILKVCLLSWCYCSSFWWYKVFFLTKNLELPLLIWQKPFFSFSILVESQCVRWDFVFYSRSLDVRVVSFLFRLVKLWLGSLCT